MMNLKNYYYENKKSAQNSLNIKKIYFYKNSMFDEIE